MLFNSFSFAIFLPIVFALYWIIPHKYRWAILLVASYYFYMSWNIKYIVLILFTTLISYLAALFMDKQATNKRKNTVLLAATLIASLGVLFIFKYFNFMNESIVNIAKIFSINLQPITLKLMLPVGISFYTFQTLSYVIDVYKGDVEAERHFGKYAAFISFFPQLVAGPIERTSNLLPQIKGEHKFNYKQATYGLKLMAWGFFKKIVIADAMAFYVDSIYNNVYAHSGLVLIIATVMFAFQIYCDFSGYSDIAIGTAKLFGINLMTNFKSPYCSASIKEFWSRWHISLSTWFRDYVYIPLGGNRVGKFRNSFNLIVTFLLSGLWHGASWTFVIWGGVHGIAQVIEKFVFKVKKSDRAWKTILRTLVVFSFCCFAWVFFRAQSMADAVYILSSGLKGIGNPARYVVSAAMDMYYTIGVSPDDLIRHSVITLAILLIYDYCSLKRDVIAKISALSPVKRWSIYCGFVLVVILSLPANGSGEFIYFQF